MSELEYMKDLFYNHLPVASENKKKVEKYFSRLEEIIFTTDPDAIERDEFPPDDPAISGSREYKYHSVDQFKKLASGHQQLPCGQDVGHSESKQAELPPTENRGADSKDLAYVQEHTQGGGASVDGREESKHFSGELDRGCSSQLPN